MKSVFIAGYNARVMACPARRAGYRAYSLSHYDDLDLLRCVDKNFTFSGDLPRDIRPWLEQTDAEKVVLGSGFEDIDLPASLVLGNDPKIARNVVNKVWLAEKLKSSACLTRVFIRVRMMCGSPALQSRSRAAAA